jgi:hypothetical protein
VLSLPAGAPTSSPDERPARRKRSAMARAMAGPITASAFAIPPSQRAVVSAALVFAGSAAAALTPEMPPAGRG